MASSDNVLAPNDEAYIQDLVKRAQNKNHAAFEELCTIFKDDIYRLILSKSGGTISLDKEMSDRLANETLSKLYEKIRDYKYENGKRFISWLSTLAINLKRDYLSSSEYKEKSKLYGTDPVIVEKDALKKLENKTPLDIAIANERKEIFKEVLGYLTDEDRFIISQRIYDGLSWVKISRNLHGHDGKADWYRSTVYPAAINRLKEIIKGKGYYKKLKDFIEE